MVPRETIKNRPFSVSKKVAAKLFHVEHVPRETIPPNNRGNKAENILCLCFLILVTNDRDGQAELLVSAPKRHVVSI